MTKLTPLAVSSAPLLRAIRDAKGPEDLTGVALARASERKPNNMPRDLGALADAGLIERPDGGPPQLTSDGAAALEALDRAEGAAPAAAASGGGGMIGLLHAQIVPDPLNPRRDFDSDAATEDLDLLRQDILQNGLLQNLLVRPAEPNGYLKLRDGEGNELPFFRLVAGERRWRAIGSALFEGDWPADRLIPCQVVETDDLGHRLRALAENLQRRNLNPIEEAKAFKGLVDLGLGTDEIADRVSVVQRQVQMRLQLLNLSEEDQQRMTLPKDDPDRLSVRGARDLLQQREASAAKPEGIDPMVLLMLAEVTDHVFRHSDPQASWRGAEIQPGAFDQAKAANFPVSWFDIGSTPDYQTGRFYVRAFYFGKSQLREKIGDAYRDDGIDPAKLAELRAAAAVEPPTEGHYSTPWLNGPFHLSPEGQSVVDKRKAQQEKDAQQRRETEEREQREFAAARETLPIMAAIQQQIAAFPPQPIMPELPASLETIGIKLPVSINGDELVDADGDVVLTLNYRFRNEAEEAAIGLLAAAINGACGLATPEPEPDEDEDDNGEDDDDGEEISPALMRLAGGGEAAPAPELEDAQ